MLLKELRQQVIDAGMALYNFHLVGLTGGNLSARDPESNLVAIKPSAISYPKIHPEDVIIIDLQGNVIDGERKPSSETPMHTCVYRARPDVNGVVHCHAPYATAWSLVNKSIPAVIVGQYLTAGEIPIAPYTMPGTQELGDCAVEALGDGYAVVLQNHGPLCVGPDLEYALEVAFAVEEAAKTALYAAQIGGEMRLMGEDIAAMLAAEKKA